MLPAATRPILEHVLDALVEAGVRQIHLVVGYRGNCVRDHFGSEHRGVGINYVEQDKQLGSGHALFAARDEVDDVFLVVEGDKIIDSKTVSAVRDAFARADSTAAVGVVERDTIGEHDAVLLDGTRVRKIAESPDNEHRLLNSGVYAVDERIFEAIEATPTVAGEVSLTDTLSRLTDADVEIHGVRTDGLWVNATHPWKLLDLNRELLVRKQMSNPQSGAHRDERVWVADTARVHDSAVLQPPVVVGSDCDVRPGAVVGPFVSLGQHTIVGSNAVVQHSVLDSDTRVGANATLVDCVTGQGVRLGAGCTIPGGPTAVQANGSIYEDQQLGALLADRVHVGGNASFEPGTLVGSGVRINAGVSVSGTVEERATVVN